MTKIKCRLCDLQKLKSFYNVHQEPLSKMMESLAGLKLTCREKISNWICSKCYYDITKAYETQKKIIQVELKRKAEEVTYFLEDQGELVSPKEKNESNLEIYSCNSCAKNFKNATEYFKHLQDHLMKVLLQKKSQIQCEHCGATFTNLKDYNAHQKTHPAKAYTCTTCSKPFATLASLTQHMKNKVHSPKPFACEICNAKFTQKTQLQGHMVQHNRRQVQRNKTHPFQCTLCTCTFKYAASLNIHKKIQHIEAAQTARK